MNFIINTIQDLAKFLKCEVSEIPSKTKNRREGAVGLTLYYSLGGVLTSDDECLTFPGKGNGTLTNPDINWNQIHRPMSFKLWSNDDNCGVEETPQLMFGHITSNELEKLLNEMDDKMYKMLKGR